MDDMFDSSEKFSADREFRRLMWVGVGLLVAAVIGVIMSTFHDVPTRSFGVIVVTMVTGGISGAAIGFLFGIPRVLTDAGPANTASSSGADHGGDSANGDTQDTTKGKRLLASNSNLEQVSDWLTKIILGVSLTQFYQLDDMLFRFEGLIGRYVGVRDQVTPLVAAIVIVFSIICGFLAMYLETRLVLSRIFDSVERDLIEQELKKAQNKVTEAKSQIEVVQAQRADAVERADQLETAVKKIADDPMTSATTLASAAESLKTAATADQASPELKSIAAQALAASGRTSEASGLIVSGAGASVRDRIAAMQVALYKAAPGGFREALAIAAALSTESDAQGSAEYWFYAAAAYGQEHHWLLTAPAGPDRDCDLTLARDHALDCVNKCLAIDSSYEIRFYLLMNPTLSTAPDDDDMADFADDPNFRAIVRGPSTTGQGASGSGASGGAPGDGTADSGAPGGGATGDDTAGGIAPSDSATGDDTPSGGATGTTPTEGTPPPPGQNG